MQHVFLTGASGFIGRHFVKHLRDRQIEVTCLVRKTSQQQHLRELECQLCEGDVLYKDSLSSAIQEKKPDVVFHLAGITKAIDSKRLYEINEQGTENLLTVCAKLPSPPAVVLVSTLAVAGPSGANGSVSRTESDPPTPVSHYGKSKLAAEQSAMKYSANVPISIVRPPIVFGPYDRDTFEMFQTISVSGFHPVPSLRAMSVSWIHVDDVCEALMKVAGKGTRLSANTEAVANGEGIYFATSPEIVDYALLGKKIATTLGNRFFLAVPTPGPLVWGLASINETAARIRGVQNILNFDKAREATAGSWTCDGTKLVRETGFECKVSLEETLRTSADWYRENGWL